MRIDFEKMDVREGGVGEGGVFKLLLKRGYVME